MTDIQILSAVKHAGTSVLFSDLMNLTQSDIQPDYVLTKNRINALINNGLLEGKAEAFGTLRLTPKGRIYLDDILEQMNAQSRQCAEEKSESERQRKSQNRHDWFVTVIGGSIQTIIGAIAGALLTLFIQSIS